MLAHRHQQRARNNSTPPPSRCFRGNSAIQPQSWPTLITAGIAATRAEAQQPALLAPRNLCPSPSQEALLIGVPTGNTSISTNTSAVATYGRPPLPSLVAAEVPGSNTQSAPSTLGLTPAGESSLQR